MKSEIKKVIIWGLPLHSHTHSYIHYGFYRAASSLGYDTVWMDDVDDEVDVENSIIIAAAGHTKHLKNVGSSVYFIHNITDDFEKPEQDNVQVSQNHRLCCV